MMSRRALGMICALAVAALLGGSHVAAQAGGQKPAADQTATQFYMAYRDAFQKAKKVEELFPYMGAEQRAQVEKTPAAERPKMFELIKSFNNFTNVKVTKETKTANGATLEVEGIGEDKKKATATVDVIREGGGWKIGKESWKM
jgi:hypothetical protein